MTADHSAQETWYDLLLRPVTGCSQLSSSSSSRRRRQHQTSSTLVPSITSLLTCAVIYYFGKRRHRRIVNTRSLIYGTGVTLGMAPLIYGAWVTPKKRTTPQSTVAKRRMVLSDLLTSRQKVVMSTNGRPLVGSHETVADQRQATSTLRVFVCFWPPDQSLVAVHKESNRGGGEGGSQTSSTASQSSLEWDDDDDNNNDDIHEAQRLEDEWEDDDEWDLPAHSLSPLRQNVHHHDWIKVLSGLLGVVFFCLVLYVGHFVRDFQDLTLANHHIADASDDLLPKKALLGVFAFVQ